MVVGHHANANVARKRKLLFAMLMSLVTVNVVSLSILIMNHVPANLLFQKWQASLFVAWPIVFISILTIAPWLAKLVDWLIKPSDRL